jgi:hypothetical protein
MKLASKFGFLRSWDAAWLAGLLLILAICFAGRVRGATSTRGMQRWDARTNLSSSDRIAISATKNHFEIRNYFLDFDGDHSLDAATVIEQPSAGYTKDTVQLHLASGVEQSVVVSAPPGGLQVEMHDMTGDKIANDVVLRPALLRWLPTVLVNDGHEHFEVAVLGPDPTSFSSKEDLGSRRLCYWCRWVSKPFTSPTAEGRSIRSCINAFFLHLLKRAQRVWATHRFREELHPSKRRFSA